MIDRFGRSIHYLRLSVTDRCNLRCVYCLPESSGGFASHPETLTDDEIVALVRVFAGLGVSKLRVTGGEPLVRPGIEDLIRRLGEIPGIEDLSLSTNAVLLAPRAAGLARAGLQRVNVSLDTLDEGRFQRMTRYGRLEDVLAGIEAALAAGLAPVKLNVVVARGDNEEELERFAHLTEERPLHVRFIELMPMGETGFFSEDRRVSFEEMKAAAGSLEPLPYKDWPAGGGPARYYRRPGAKGTVGFITALSCGFCGSCNRVRLSAQGALIPCLDGEESIDLRGPLRSGSGPEAIRSLVLDTIARVKPERHFMIERASSSGFQSRTMCQIGG